MYMKYWNNKGKAGYCLNCGCFAELLSPDWYCLDCSYVLYGFVGLQEAFEHSTFDLGGV
jgi:hypothetical protein